MLNLANATFRYDPYPIGYATKVLDEAVYARLANSFPALSELRRRDSLGNKFILTEFDVAQYHDFLVRHPEWREFYDAVKDKAFITSVLTDLTARGIDLGLADISIVQDHYFSGAGTKLMAKLRRAATRVLQIGPNPNFRLASRFEFGAFPGDGGSQYPHTDTPRKVVSTVLSMNREGEWDPAWGGGTAVVRPKDVTKNFNYLNAYLGFDDVETIDTFRFVPNCCVVFVKTFNSWHAVNPITAPPDAVRKTVVINIDLHGIPSWKSDY